MAGQNSFRTTSTSVPILFPADDAVRRATQITVPGAVTTTTTTGATFPMDLIVLGVVIALGAVAVLVIVMRRR